MDRLPNPIAPTAEMPVIGHAASLMLEALRAGRSYHELMLTFPALAQHLRDLPNVGHLRGLSLTAASLVSGHRTPGSMLWKLFHSIPRDQLQSILLNTVAFDQCRWDQPQVTSLDDGAGGGVYVFGLAVKRQNGHFIQGLQLQRLIADMERYADAWEAWNGGRLDGNAELQSFVEEVDSQYGYRNPDGKPKWINNAVKLGCVRVFVAQLRLRLDSAMTHDPTGIKRQIQSPLYVGCSNDLARRKPKHKPRHGASAFQKSNKLYALTASLLARRGVTVVPIFVTAIRTWEENQLPLAEILVSALAGSYVNQGGFNIIEAGGQGDKQSEETLEWSRFYVLGGVSHLSQNVSGSRDEARRRVAHIALFAELEGRFGKSEADDLKDMVESSAELVHEATRIEQEESKLDLTQEDSEAFLLEEERHGDKMQVITGLFDALLS